MLTVSLILTTYNSLPNIQRTLESIECQDYPEIEVIIKDGGSTDGTLDVIKNYENKSKYSVRWVNCPDTGIYDAKVTERAATTYFVMLFKKLQPILVVKNGGSVRDTELKNSFHTEFLTLVERIKTIERKK